MVDRNEILQLETLVKTLELRFSKFSYTDEESVNMITTALKLNNHNFTEGTFSKFKYNFIELRLLYLLAVIYGAQRKITESNNVLSFLLSYMPETVYNPQLRNRLLIKVVSYMAYNYYRIMEDEETIKYCDMGIELCLSNYIYDTLDVLYFRKGVALYSLGNPEYMEYLKKSVYILYISNNINKLNEYLKVLEDKYQIHIDI